MFWNAWNANQQTMPAASSRPAGSASRAMRSPRQHSSPNSADDDHAADEAELLAGHRVDEVGLLLGNVPAVGLRTAEQAASEQATVGDRDVRLRDVVGGALGVVGRMGERRDALDLVLRQHAGLHRDDRQQHAGDDQARPSTEP